jgi:Ca-activated chloride channel family protein
MRFVKWFGFRWSAFAMAVVLMAAGIIAACSRTENLPFDVAKINTFNGAAGPDGVPAEASAGVPPAPGIRSAAAPSAEKPEELWIIPRDPAELGIKPSADAPRGGGTAGRGGGGGGGGARGGGRGIGGQTARGTAGRGRGPIPSTPDASDLASIPGSPILIAQQAGGRFIPIPLKHTDVSAMISGYIASVGVTQQFTNPYAEKIEAVYVFPLPENAGINDFVMTIGERHIRGIIRERAQAEQLYAEARRQGYVASLMNQERPNIFTQKVANIEPGKQIDISIRYFHTLAYNDGWFEWVFPMVVGPRYNPAGSSDGVGALPRNAPPMSSGQSTEVHYLRPNERSGHDISLSIQLDPGVSLEELVSVNHKINRQDGPHDSTLITLSPADSFPNKDFVLRYKVAGNKPKTALFVQKAKKGPGGYFTLMIVPPEDLRSLPRRPVEMVFVVDTSGSMSGQPIAQAKAAVDVALQKMTPGDTFQVVKFASGAEQMSPGPMIVDGSSVAFARQYVRDMQGNGGTEMLKGINAALDFPHDENRTRIVSFLTDGYIGNEIQILRALHDKLLDSRVFSFGVGSSPNRYLLDAMARLGHGNAAYLSLNEPAEPVMNAYFERISHPALANIKVRFGDGRETRVTDVYPQRIPELFVGRPIIITGRYAGRLPGDISVTSSVGGEMRSFPVTADARENPAIATVWARMKIADLHDEAIYEGRDVTADVKETALSYGLMSEVTSFLAVDSTAPTVGDHGVTVAIPVPVPEGVRYETTVAESSSARQNR